MGPNLNRSAILVGLIDSFCLVCEIHIQSEKEALKHVTEAAHLANLETTKVVEKYKNDYILKVKQGYYCVYCNTAFQTRTKVSLHIETSQHRTTKGNQLLRWEGAAVAFHDLLLDGCAWHGIVDDMCTVCNVELDDGGAHKAESAHLFNLAKNKVEFGPERIIFRWIDDTTFQCLTCNIVLHKQALITHFKELEHLNVLQQCANAYRDLKEKQDVSSTTNDDEEQSETKVRLSDCKVNIAPENDEEIVKSYESYSNESCVTFIDKAHTEEQNVSKILESVTMFEKNEVNINFESEIAFCKKCLGNIILDYETIEKHIEEHKRNPRKRDVGYVPFQCEVDMKSNNEALELEKQTKSTILALDYVHEECSKLDVNHNVAIASNLNASKCPPAEHEDPAEFARCHDITYTIGNSNAYCRMCEVRLPFNLRHMKEHVNGYRHKKNSNKPKTNHETFPEPSVVLTKNYVKHGIYKIKNISDNEAVVNKEFCMEELSVHLITKVGERFRCQVCEVSFSERDRPSHQTSFRHKLVLGNIPVWTKYESEFVREVRPGLFHCGFCNLIEPSEQDLLVHFGSKEHQQKKKLYERRLRCHLPLILEQERSERMADVFLYMMLGRMPFFL